jgi:hypothetical protein
MSTLGAERVLSVHHWNDNVIQFHDDPQPRVAFRQWPVRDGRTQRQAENR